MPTAVPASGSDREGAEDRQPCRGWLGIHRFRLRTAVSHIYRRDLSRGQLHANVRRRKFRRRSRTFRCGEGYEKGSDMRKIVYPKVENCP